MRALLPLLVLFATPAAAQHYDLLIRNARVIDGAGTPWFKADLAIQGDTIAAIGNLRAATAGATIDARGLAAAPGFIDIHTHSRGNIAAVPTAENYVRQGVTTLMEGNDGGSPLPLGAYLEKVAALRPAVNFGMFVGQGSIRSEVMGSANRPAARAEIVRMRELAREAMLQGAFGLSTGLYYVPGNYTPTEEVIEIARAVAPLGGIHISHMRDEAAGILESVKETIRIGEEGGLPTQITHHKIIGAPNWGLSKETLRLVEEARARGVDVTIDQYPYTASSTGTRVLFPQWSQEGGRKQFLARLQDPATRARLKAAAVANILENRGGGDPKNIVIASCSFDPSLAGKSLAQITRERGVEPTPENAAETALYLEEKGGCSAIYHAISEDDLVRILRYPFTMVASDGGIPIFGQASPHPRSYGTFARVLGRYVRELKVLTLEDAVRRMSAIPAARLGLADRGLLRLGMRADVVLFDPAIIADKATFENPHQYAVGVRHVLVNGKPVLLDGKITTERPGRVLYGPARSTR